MKRLFLILSVATVMMVGTAAMDAVQTVTYSFQIKDQFGNLVNDVDVIINGTVKYAANGTTMETFLVGTKVEVTAIPRSSDYATASIEFTAGTTGVALTLTVNKLVSEP